MGFTSRISTTLCGLLLARACDFAQTLSWQNGIAKVEVKAALNRVPGTAFVVALRSDTAYLVTSAHVIAGDSMPKITFQADPDHGFPATVRFPEFEERGLALLVVKSPPPGAVVLAEADVEAPVTASVGVVGFPSSVGGFTIDPTTIASKRSGDIFLSRDTDEGFSGGPVLINGRVVGLIYGHAQGRGIAVASSRVRVYLRDNNISWGVVPPSGPVERKAGETRKNPMDELTYVWIPPGKFMMGCSPGDRWCADNEKPPHWVTITRGFWMGQTEVTQAAYERVMSANPSYFKGAQRPVTGTWDQGQRYCGQMRMRLPTEAEWEYAARAGNPNMDYGNLDRTAWWEGNSGGHKTHGVAEKEPNAWRLYDMLGNAEEWVADRYEEKYYTANSAVDPQGPVTGRGHVRRGGFCYAEASCLRVSYRDPPGITGRASNIDGFRCVGGELP
jgi:formylglycine-generating enzyme required for sulfatase activity